MMMNEVTRLGSRCEGKLKNMEKITEHSKKGHIFFM